MAALRFKTLEDARNAGYILVVEEEGIEKYVEENTLRTTDTDLILDYNKDAYLDLRRLSLIFKGYMEKYYTAIYSKEIYVCETQHCYVNVIALTSYVHAYEDEEVKIIELVDSLEEEFHLKYIRYNAM